MTDMTKRLFVGIKISKALQMELDSPVQRAKPCFDSADNKDTLQIIHMGEHRFIGRYIEDGVAARDINEVSRCVCSMVKLASRGRRIEENDVQIFSS